jgi:hypothetical protein
MTRSDWTFMLVAATWVLAAILGAPPIRPATIETRTGEVLRCAYDAGGTYLCSPQR